MHRSRGASRAVRSRGANDASRHCEKVATSEGNARGGSRLAGNRRSIANGRLSSNDVSTNAETLSILVEPSRDSCSIERLSNDGDYQRARGVLQLTTSATRYFCSERSLRVASHSQRLRPADGVVTCRVLLFFYIISINSERRAIVRADVAVGLLYLRPRRAYDRYTFQML